MIEPRLSDADKRALDLLIECGMNPATAAATSTEERRRCAALASSLQALERYPVHPAPDVLVEATLARIVQADRQREDRLRLDSARGSGRAFRTADGFALAATLIFAACIALPLLSGVRTATGEAQCQNNMRSLLRGFYGYAGDQRSMLPATAGFSGFSSGENTAAATASAANGTGHSTLSMLAHQGYCPIGCVHCNAGRKLSYRLPMHPSQATIHASSILPLVADRNPELESPSTAANKEQVAPDTNAGTGSDNHGRRGLNVLFGEGSIAWMASPVVTIRVKVRARQENLWLPRDIDGVEGFTDRPASHSPFDVFLTN